MLVPSIKKKKQKTLRVTEDGSEVPAAGSYWKNGSIHPFVKQSKRD